MHTHTVNAKLVPPAFFVDLTEQDAVLNSEPPGDQIRAVEGIAALSIVMEARDP